MTVLKNLNKFSSVITEIKKNNYNLALELLKKIRSNKEERHLEYKLYGSIFFKKNEWLKSIEYFNKVLNYDKKDLVVLNNIGVALYNIGRYRDSIKFFEKLSKLESNPVNSLSSLGITYKNLGNYEKAIENFLKVLNLQNNNNLVKQYLIDIFNFYVPKKTKNNYLLELNEKILDLNKNFKFTKPVDIEFIKNFLNKNLSLLQNLNLEYKETQIFRRNTTNLNCDRHFKVFNEFKVIPKYCFNCFKIQIELRNIIDLIKLFFIFNNIELKRNNIRKCIAETRNNVYGNYKGFIFCDSLKEAKQLNVLFSDEIKKSKIKVKSIKIKHGCTEFYEEYPEYEKINYNGEQSFKYLNDWKVKEDIIDRRIHRTNGKDEKVLKPTINKISLSDILIIKNWIAYADLIDDKSYHKIFTQQIKSKYLNETIKDQINFRRIN